MKISNFFFYLICLGFFLNHANAQQIPVTNKPVNNGDGAFRFAIVSDRTGGMQQGIFKQTIYKVNLMQPEFVISVGDLIDGYTEDPNVWNAQWDEFNAVLHHTLKKTFTQQERLDKKLFDEIYEIA